MGGAFAELKHTMSLRYLAIQIDALERRGFPKQKSFEILGLNPARIKHAQKRIALDAVETLFEAAEKHFNDPHISLRIGSDFRVPNFGKTGPIYVYCNDIEHVIEINSRYQRLAVDVGDISYIQETDGSKLRHFLNLVPYEGPAYYKHVYSMIAGAYNAAFKWLGWSAGKDIKAVYFPWAEPENTSAYTEVYETDIEILFSQPSMRVEFYPECMETKLSLSDPEKLAQATAIMDDLLQSHTASESFHKAVEMTMRAALNLGVISIGTIANRMNMSERELRQKLKDEELSYRNMLDDVRKKIFAEMLDDETSFSEISQELGYNDQAAFNRAFKRWYGMSPTAYRKAQSGA